MDRRELRAVRANCGEGTTISQYESKAYEVRPVVRALDVLAELGRAREPMALASVAR
jgi:hypothetical protein